MNVQWFLSRWRPISAVLAIVLSSLLGIGLVVADDDGDGQPDRITVTAPTATPTVTPSATDVLEEAAAEQPPAAAPAGDVGHDLRAEPSAPGKHQGQARTEAIAENLAPRGPPAARVFGPKCVVDYSGQVYSDRAHPATQFVLHYTVSSNRAGWSDVRAIQNYFKSTRVASAHYIIDFEGHCLKMVPLSKKAWTQGNANSASVSVEIIATGRETREQWLASPLIKYRKLARLARRVMDSAGFPLRRTNPVGCVFPSGLTDHLRLECGNHHTDVAPNFPWRKFMRDLRTVR